LGNKWGEYSAIQVVGFGFVTLGLLVYDGTMVRLPWLIKYPDQPTGSPTSSGEEEKISMNEVSCRASMSTEAAVEQ
jgi:hypothetical protein